MFFFIREIVPTAIRHEWIIFMFSSVYCPENWIRPSNNCTKLSRSSWYIVALALNDHYIFNGFILTNRCRIAKTDNYLRVLLPFCVSYTTVIVQTGFTCSRDELLRWHRQDGGAKMASLGTICPIFIYRSDVWWAYANI